MAHPQNIILNLRPAESIGSFEKGFTSEQVVNIPLTKFKPFEPERVLSLLGHIQADYPQKFDGIVLTSAKAAKSLALSNDIIARIKAMQKHEPTAIFCVGVATAKVVQELDLGTIHEGDGGAFELAELADKTLRLKERKSDEGFTLLFPCGVHIHDKTMPSFFARDLSLVPLRVYDMPKAEGAEQHLSALIAESLRHDDRHYIVPFFSMRSLEIFADIIKDADQEAAATWLARHSALCLSPVMVKLAQNIGFKNIVSAQKPSASSMREAIQALLKS